MTHMTHSPPTTTPIPSPKKWMARSEKLREDDLLVPVAVLRRRVFPQGEDLSRKDLSGIDLAKVDLTRYKLVGANLAKAFLTQTILCQADLSGADLTEAFASESNMTGASLRRADLSGTDLSSADLTRADLTYATMSGTRLTNTNLSHTNLRMAHLDNHILTGYWESHSASPHGWEYRAFQCLCSWYILAGCRRMSLSEMTDHYTTGKHRPHVKQWIMDRLEWWKSQT